MSPDGVGDGWLRRFGPPVRNGDVRLFCFPHAGAAADVYLALSRELAPAVEVWAVQYPGRQDRRAEAVLGSAAELADGAAAAVRAAGDGPYALFGHSMGALVAYETARRLERRPGPAGGPLRLLVSGQSAPRVHERRTDLPADDGLVDEIRRIDPGSAMDDPELADLVLPVLRADYSVLRSYRWEPGPPLRTGITTLCGDYDPLTTTVNAAHWLAYSVIPGRAEVVPGGHFYLRAENATVAATIRRDLLRLSSRNVAD